MHCAQRVSPRLLPRDGSSAADAGGRGRCGSSRSRWYRCGGVRGGATAPRADDHCTRANGTGLELPTAPAAAGAAGDGAYLRNVYRNSWDRHGNGQGGATAPRADHHCARARNRCGNYDVIWYNATFPHASNDGAVRYYDVLPCTTTSTTYVSYRVGTMECYPVVSRDADGTTKHFAPNYGASGRNNDYWSNASIAAADFSTYNGYA